MATQQTYGTGRRKSAIARVWLTPGEGKISINGRDFKEYLGRPVLEILLKSPLVDLHLDGTYDVKDYCKGGGLPGQAGAVNLRISHPLLEVNEDPRKEPRPGSFRTRDP